MENPWNKLNPKQKKIATIILAFIGVNLFFVGIFLLVWRLFNPPCEMGQKRYKEYGGLCGPICKDTQEVCPKKDDKGNYITINCVEKCPVGKTYDMGTCNEKTGYCKPSCKSPAVPVNTTRGWDCGIYCESANSDGFPKNYCVSTDICGSTRQGPYGDVVTGCINNMNMEECTGSDGFYCPKGTCATESPKPSVKENYTGNLYCKVPMCDKTSFCKTDAKEEMCKDNGKCEVYADKDKTLSNKGITDVGTCSVPQVQSYQYCGDTTNVGVKSNGDMFICPSHNPGISLIGDKQCPNNLVANGIPCCKYGLCDNGWQCKNKDGEKCSTKTFTDFTSKDKVCCEDGEYEYQDQQSKQTLCCPDKPIDGKCLNTTKYGLDNDWLDYNGSYQCNDDDGCKQQYLDKVKKLLPDLDFDNSDSESYGKLFCYKEDPKDNNGTCKLGCGVAQKVKEDGTLDYDLPYTVLNIFDNDPQSSRCIKNDNTLKILSPPTTIYPQGDTFSNFNTNTTLLCSTGPSDLNYYWAQNKDNGTGNAGNYKNTVEYTINSSNPEDCYKVFPLRPTKDIQTSNISINKSMLNKAIGTPVEGKEQTLCKSDINCNIAQSNGFNLSGISSQPYNWWQDSNSLNTIFPENINDMRFRVSKILDPSKTCESIQPTSSTDCDIGSIPDKFTDKQVTSPCYYNPKYPNRCLSKNLAVHTVDTLDNTLTCDEKDNCLPRFLSTGEFCPYGTHDGRNCLNK